MTQTKIQNTRPEHALTGVAAAAAGAFTILLLKVRKPHSILGDLRMRGRLPSYDRGTSRAVTPFGHLGKKSSVLSGAALVAGKLFLDGSKPGAAAVMGSTVAGVAASYLFDATLPQKTPPPGRKAPFDPHFPSGHTLNSTSLLGTTAWVLSREGKGDARIISAAAGALIAAFGVDRVFQDRHWTSDILGGWLAGITVCALSAAAYEIAKRNAAPPGERQVSHRGPARKIRR